MELIILKYILIALVVIVIIMAISLIMFIYIFGLWVEKMQKLFAEIGEE